MTTLQSTVRPAVSPVPVAAVSVLTALVFTCLGAHTWGEIAIVAAVVAVTAGFVYGVVVPRALRKESAGGTALALSIPAVLLLLPAFWAGIPIVLGAAAAVVGNAGRHARSGSGTAIAGLVLGVLAVLGYLAIYLSDLASGGAGFLFD